ncbi:hypothetical protein GCM10010156_51030 [Planobispora rosea]|uniref:Uncharacterized protein n=1 Tax=Planobispora rosea TaxID=35762 RepID=A0A8J3SG12_PLARO|nr:hypothetical protein [Planobispora rosea]GGS86290.1 hypothetical protein GCM10010156_51030 [Planobispora rosea]GIH89023.1 hypothetical protein Pro02_74310 [Planobispora rosea]
MSEDADDLWPVLPSEIVADTLADPAVSAEVFSTVAALMVAICENPWLKDSEQLSTDPDWREILIPKGYGIAEYRISRNDHHVVLTRIVLF